MSRPPPRRSISSAMPVRRETTSGTPASIASAADMPKLSYDDGIARTSIPARKSARDRGGTNPSHAIRSSTPSSAARRRAGATTFSGPSRRFAGARTRAAVPGHRSGRARSSSALIGRDTRLSDPRHDLRQRLVRRASRRGAHTGSSWPERRAAATPASRLGRQHEQVRPAEVQRLESELLSAPRGAPRRVDVGLGQRFVRGDDEQDLPGPRRRRPLRAAMFQTPWT